MPQAARRAVETSRCAVPECCGPAFVRAGSWRRQSPSSRSTRDAHEPMARAAHLAMHHQPQLQQTPIGSQEQVLRPRRPPDPHRPSPGRAQPPRLSPWR
eukprot:scaffold5943_cov113-Isochrysis_galbana.AAC.3